jgi:hypothetical protein
VAREETNADERCRANSLAEYVEKSAGIANSTMTAAQKSRNQKKLDDYFKATRG